MFHNVTSCDIDRDKFDDFNNLDNHCLNNAFYTRKIDLFNRFKRIYPMPRKYKEFDPDGWVECKM